MLNDAGSIVRINVFETGLAFAIKYEGQDRVAVACYGDGAANQARNATQRNATQRNATHRNAFNSSFTRART